jgi:hypothetical protein
VVALAELAQHLRDERVLVVLRPQLRGDRPGRAQSRFVGQRPDVECQRGVIRHVHHP